MFWYRQSQCLISLVIFRKCSLFESMPCKSEILDTSETSKPELENSAIAQTTHITSKADEVLVVLKIYYYESLEQY